MFLNDQETATDLLYYEAIAKTVVIETIVDELRRARPNSTKVADAAKKVLKRVDWLKLARKAGGFLKEAPKDSDNLPEHIHFFRKEFEELLDAADIDQIVVIVDDLDRCLPKTAIATLEAIRLSLFVDCTAFVIGADELMIEYAVREHFPDLPPSSGAVSYARNYLEKLIQVPFRIPALGLAETRVYITLLTAENEARGAAEARSSGSAWRRARRHLNPRLAPAALRGLTRSGIVRPVYGARPRPHGLLRSAIQHKG